MEIILIGYLLKKSINEGKKDETINKDDKNELKQIDKSTETTSFISSLFFNLILVITAVMLAYNKNKDESKSIKVGSMIFAVIFPIIYLMFNIILTIINKIKNIVL